MMEAARRMFENRVLRRLFGPKRDEATRGWIKLRNEELHSLYFSQNIITVIKSRRFELGGTCSAHGRDKKCVQSFGWKS
jgi:hypothetical protein